MKTILSNASAARAAAALLLSLAAGCRTLFPPDPVATATSPDGRNEIRLYLDPLSYDVRRDGNVIVAYSEIDMKLGDGSLAETATEENVSQKADKRKGVLATPLYRKSQIALKAGESFASFGDWGIRLLARDDGVAYRFETSRDGEIAVAGERADIVFDDDGTRLLASVIERPGDAPGDASLQVVRDLEKSVPAGGRRRLSGTLFFRAHAKSALAFECDVYDYPTRLFVAGDDDDALSSVFAATGSVLTTTAGTRTYPWRAFALADSVSELAESDLALALSPVAERRRDFSWVRPGRVVAESSVAIARGRAAYAEAADNWCVAGDPLRFQDDLAHRVEVAREEGLGLLVGVKLRKLDGESGETALSALAKAGVAGLIVKTPVGGGPAHSVALERIASLAADAHLVVVFRGGDCPAGLMRRYPNVLSCRAAAGTVRDYYLGATVEPLDALADMNGEGTCVRRMATAIVFASPVQTMRGTPDATMAARERYRFIASTPTVWDASVGLPGTPDTFAACARRRGDVWYAACINDGDAATYRLYTHFLPTGDWTAEIFRDGPDAALDPASIRHTEQNVRAGSRLELPVAAGGGFVVRFRKGS